MSNKTQLNEIGWREWLTLPELNINAIKAKVDTGAKTSALHTYKIEMFKQGTEDYVRFWIHPFQNNQDISCTCETKIIDQRQVKDSGGHVEDRIIISTPVLLADKQWEIEISLTNRENMLFRMLLGRSAIVKGNYYVNPAVSYVKSRELASLYDPKIKEEN